MKTEPRTLLVKLTEEERNERAMSATETLRARDNADSHAKLQAKLNKGAVEKLEAELRKLSSAAREGSEMQEVMCTWIPDFSAGVMRLRRDDTGAIVERRSMSDDERQSELFQS